MCKQMDPLQSIILKPSDISFLTNSPNPSESLQCFFIYFDVLDMFLRFLRPLKFWKWENT